MSNVTVDGVEYELDTLSDNAKAQLHSIQYVDAEITRLNAMLAAFQTARLSYGRELAAELGNTENKSDTNVELPETLSFD